MRLLKTCLFLSTPSLGTSFPDTFGLSIVVFGDFITNDDFFKDFMNFKHFLGEEHSGNPIV